MDPKALWKQAVESARKIIQLTEKISRDEEMGVSLDAMDFAELNDEADSIAMDVLNLDEWIEKGGFSPFSGGEEQELSEIEEEIKSWE